MGTGQSTHATMEITGGSPYGDSLPRSVSGRKQSSAELDPQANTVISEQDEIVQPSVISDDDSIEEADDYDSDEEEDEEWNERLAIFEDIRKLRQVAEFFLYPEKPVTVEATACARCYFTRPSAPEQATIEMEEEASLVIEEAKALKKYASHYMHPELPVQTDDATAFGRNYFSRPSAYVQDDEEEAEERERVLADARALKKLAVDYMHPEKPVVSTDPCATGRNYFTRPSAYIEEDTEEHERILADAMALKKLAMDYMHPELPVVTSDPCACGRNYFTRPSAEEYEDEDDMDERDDILEDMSNLKRLAQDYLQPERPVEVSPFDFGRNYFTRPSAPTSEEEEERAKILSDAAALKKLAEDYMHPERPVVTTDPFACGRNYFSRPSAFTEEDVEDEEERERILADAMALKKLAVDYLHPEKPVVTTDPCATGRNYFTRPSAEEYEDEDDMDKRDDILEDMSNLKRLAQDYLQPERPVEVSPFDFGRNYFTRPSAPTSEEEEERAKILSDAAALKKLAEDYMHPERPVVTTDPFACGRNYFSRPSAFTEEDVEDEEERERILADAMALKKLAVDYLHPEKPVVTTDPCATGRNYFTRPSAEEYSDSEQAQILEEMAQLKTLAMDYMHPELPVVTSDPCACGRNYFTRPSVEEYEDEDDMDERDDILEDMSNLKRLAQDYLQSERPVEVSPFDFGRNYFTRPSAPTSEEEEERAKILSDAAALKKLAEDYMHPERPVVTTDPFACGRNYFSRPSAFTEEDVEDEEERERILADAMALKKLAVDYLHPEKPVVTTDPCATGRNYFTRPSAEEYSDSEQAQILEEMAQLKKLAMDYMHPELPVVTSDPCACGRNYFSRPSAEDEEAAREREAIFEDLASLKKVAMDYMHPELPVTESDPFAKGRNYFSRASAPGHAEYIHTQGHEVQHSDESHQFVPGLHGYYQYHEDDHSHPDYHSQSDHFEMDEDVSHVFREFRQSLHSMVPLKGAEIPKESDEEGKLSRSPSSVMLFDESAAAM